MARALRILGCCLAGLVLGVGAYGALVAAGVARNPFAPALAGDIGAARSARPGLRVLFVGNSFTYVNDMPGMVERLAAARPGATPVFVVSYTKGATQLAYWADDGGLQSLLREVHWNRVVLQEQSQIPSFPEQIRDSQMLPAASSLTARAGTAGARAVLFMTWGYRDGNGAGDSFDAMQARLVDGYDQVARATGAQVAPVGLAWQQAHRLAPSLALWQDDGMHPSRAGSYLAACVFFEVLTGRSPVGDAYTAGLAGAEARFLQGVAHRTVTAAPG